MVDGTLALVAADVEGVVAAEETAVVVGVFIEEGVVLVSTTVVDTAADERSVLADVTPVLKFAICLFNITPSGS